MAMYKIDGSVLKIIYLVITVISNTLVACVTAALPEIKKIRFFSSRGETTVARANLLIALSNLTCERKKPLSYHYVALVKQPQSLSDMDKRLRRP